MNTKGLDTPRKYRSLSVGMTEHLGLINSLSQQFEQRMRRGREMVTRERRLAMVMSLLVGVFTLCYLPFWSVYVCLSFIPSCPPPTPFSMAMVQWMALISSLVNPVIYTVFHRDFKLAVMGIARGCFNFR